MIVSGIDLRLHEGETLALVGESGCGKTMTAYSIMRLLPGPRVRVAGGRILFRGRNLLECPEDEMRAIRGNAVSMIFQEPLTALNPVFTVGMQIAEPLRVHKNMSKKQAREYAVKLLGDVGIPSPKSRFSDYPHQMSGGMRQRVMIAMALACDPDVVIADEPTTALDVTVQAQIMDLLDSLKQSRRMGLLLITHDLGVVAESAQTVAVMYGGRIMEYCDVKALFSRPLNPYTRGLIQSLPAAGRNRLAAIRGMVPSVCDFPQGCRFSTRCDSVMDICRRAEPDLVPVEGNGSAGHAVRCWLYQDTHS